jgi:rifampicin phosphotransferase
MEQPAYFVPMSYIGPVSSSTAPIVEQPNLLHMVSSPTTFFSTGNVAEAAPGVHTPLGWSIWGGLTERVLSEVVVALGAWSRPPDVSDVNHRFGCIFYGRYAANVNTFRAFGDRMPGTSGDAVEIQFFGAKMSQEHNRPVRQRYPVVAAKMPSKVIRTPLTGRTTMRGGRTESVTVHQPGWPKVLRCFPKAAGATSR